MDENDRIERRRQMMGGFATFFLVLVTVLAIAFGVSSIAPDRQEQDEYLYYKTSERVGGCDYLIFAVTNGVSAVHDPKCPNHGE